MDTKKTDKNARPRARARAVVKTDKTTRTGPVLKTGRTARYRRVKKTGKTTRAKPVMKTDKPARTGAVVKTAKTRAAVRNNVDVVNQEEDGAHPHQVIQRQPSSSSNSDNLLRSTHVVNRGLESLAM